MPRRPAAEVRERRAEILRIASQVASVNGFGALSIGDLADRMSMSKSGLFAHFGSKQQLQLSALRAALDVFLAEVWTPAYQARTGRERLDALIDAWLSYLEREVFAGGCVLAAAAAEFDAQPGQMRDEVAAAMHKWLAMLAREIGIAQAAGEVLTDVSPQDVAFALNAFATSANIDYQLHRDTAIFQTARRAMNRSLGEHRAESPPPAATT